MNTKRDREASIQHGMRYCAHYNGVAVLRGLQGKCHAGVPYHDVGATMKERPCLDGHLRESVNCQKWERVTAEKAASDHDEFEAHLKKVMESLKVIGPWKVKPKPQQDRKEIIACPICNGQLHLSQSSYNGHVHAHCETPKCISFME